MALDSTYLVGSTSTTTGLNGMSTGKNATKGKADLDMNDFIMLMVEQVKQQDMYNTTDTTQYINQLSQYTMIESLTTIQEQLSSGLANIQEMSLSAYSMSMLGKEATLAVESGNEGEELKTVTGLIEGVSYYNGEPMVVIDGEQYKLSQIMSVAEKNSEASDKLAVEAAEAAKRAADAAEALVQMKTDEIVLSENTEDTETVENVENTENAESTESTENTESAGNTENVETPDNTENGGDIDETPTPFGDVIQ